MSDDNSEERDFLNRWSRKKAQARTAIATEEVTIAALEEGDAGSANEIASLEPDGRGGVDAETPTETTDETNAEAVTSAEEIPPEIADIDIESLTYDSDFTVFMKDNVPEIVRRQALRQLWRSDPILANVDGLNDYDEDFTDAALVVKGLKSAYRVGKGYLTAEDEDEAEAADAKGADETDDDAPAAETADAEASSSDTEVSEQTEEEEQEEKLADSEAANDTETIEIAEVGDDVGAASDTTGSDTAVAEIVGEPIKET